MCFFADLEFRQRAPSSEADTNCRWIVAKRRNLCNFIRLELNCLTGYYWPLRRFCLEGFAPKNEDTED